MHRYLKILNKVRQLKQVLFSYERFYLLVREPSDVDSGEKRIFDNDIIFKLVDDDNIADTMNFEGKHYITTYRQMLDEGETGLFGYINEECIYRLWVKLKGDERYLRRRVFDIKKGEAYIHYCYTKCDARGKGVHTLGVKMICDLFPNRRLLSLVANDNIASIKSFEKNGFKKEKLITILCVGGIVFKYEKKTK